jgi:hypothetical protein
VGDGGFYVKVLYWPPALGTFDITLDVQGCEAECNLTKFVQRSKPYVIEQDIQAVRSSWVDVMEIRF